MYDEIREAVQQRGIYSVARNSLLKRTQAEIPIIIEGRTTTQYILVPALEDTPVRVLYDAALRLWEEGFYTAAIYLKDEGNIPFLLVVWDANISCELSHRMPCFDCIRVPAFGDVCSGCASFDLWSKNVYIPGSFVPCTSTSNDASETSKPEQPSDIVILSEIPSAVRMQEISRIASRGPVTYFEDTVAVRMAKKLEAWPTRQHIPVEFFSGVSTSDYVTVALTPRECSERDLLRKVIISLERKGYCCGPMVSTHDRPVLFATWDERLITCLPDRSPCITDCEATRSGLPSCYCTEFNAWFAKWDNAVQDIKVLEQ